MTNFENEEAEKKKVTKRALYVLYLIAFLDLFAVSLFLPLISKQIQNLGASPFQIGLISSIYGAIQLFSSPIIGRWSDKYGRKFVLLNTICLSSFAYFLQGFSASTSSLYYLLAARSIAGLFKHTQTLGKSFLPELYPNELSFVIGNFNAVGSIGFIVGPTVGGHLVALDGFRYVCYLASATFLLNAILVLFLIPRSKTLADKNSKNNTAKRNTNCCNLEDGLSGQILFTLSTILLLRFLYSYSTILTHSNLPLVLEAKYQTSVVNLGYISSLQALTSTLTGFCVGPIISNIFHEKHKKIVVIFGLIQAIGFLGLYFSPSFRFAGISLMIVSGANPFLRVGLTSLSLQLFLNPGSILGLIQTSTSISRMIGPLSSGSLQEISNDWPALGSFISSILGTIVCIICIRDKKYKILTNRIQRV